MQKNLSLIIPVFNDNKALQEMIQAISENYTQLVYPVREVIVVDDGSFDKVNRIFSDKKFVSRYGFKIRFLRHKINLGKGAAIKTGMRESKGSHIMFLDVDQSTDWGSVKNLLEFSFKNPEYVVCGSRAMKKSVIKVKQPKWRALLGKTGSRIIHFFFKIPIKDTQCGCKIFPKKITEIFIEEGYTNRWAVDIEWLSKCVRYKVPLKEFPVVWKDSKKSQVKPWHFITTAVEVFIILIKK